MTPTDALVNLLSCFAKRDYWWQHKANDGVWVDVSEDLKDYLDEAAELLDSRRVHW